MGAVGLNTVIVGITWFTRHVQDVLRSKECSNITGLNTPFATLLSPSLYSYVYIKNHRVYIRFCLFSTSGHRG